MRLRDTAPARAAPHGPAAHQRSGPTDESAANLAGAAGGVGHLSWGELWRLTLCSGVVRACAPVWRRDEQQQQQPLASALSRVQRRVQAAVWAGRRRNIERAGHERSVSAATLSTRVPCTRRRNAAGRGWPQGGARPHRVGQEHPEDHRGDEAGGCGQGAPRPGGRHQLAPLHREPRQGERARRRTFGGREARASRGSLAAAPSAEAQTAQGTTPVEGGTMQSRRRCCTA